jgi:hypothetical protein
VITPRQEQSRSGQNISRHTKQSNFCKCNVILLNELDKDEDDKDIEEKELRGKFTSTRFYCSIHSKDIFFRADRLKNRKESQENNSPQATQKLRDDYILVEFLVVEWMNQHNHSDREFHPLLLLIQKI